MSANRWDEGIVEGPNDRFEKLWASFLDEGLSDAEGAELNTLLAADETLLERAANLYSVHRQLPVLLSRQRHHRREEVGGEERGDEPTVDSPGADDDFVASVMARIGSPLRSSPLQKSIGSPVASVVLERRHSGAAQTTGKPACDRGARTRLSPALQSMTIVQWMKQIGGQNALTLTAWGVTLPFSVLVSSVYATPPTLSEVIQWTSALVGIHVVLGLLMLIARHSVLPDRRRASRPLTALLVFAGMGAVRGGLLAVTQEALGLGAFTLVERMAFNVGAVTFSFVLLAIIIDDYRRDAVIQQRLRRAFASLATLRAVEEASLLRVGGRVPQPLALPTNSMALAKGGWSDLVSRMQVPSPVLVVGTYQCVTFFTVVARVGGMAAVIYAGLTALPSLVGLMLVRRFLPLPRRGVLRVAVLSAAVAAVGAVAAVVTSWPLGWFFGSGEQTVVSISAGLLAVVLVFSAAHAAYEGRKTREDALAKATAEEAQCVSRVHVTLAAVQDGGGLMSGLTADANHAKQQFDAVVYAWNAVLPVHSVIEPSAWMHFVQHPQGFEALLRIVSAGMVDAVRYSNGGRVVIQLLINKEDDTAALELITHGDVDCRPSLSMRQDLEALSRSAVVRSDEDRMLLSVTL